jgi:hypothetical protein
VTNVQLLHAVPDYEPLRAWAVSPVSSPPPGWQHLLRGGMATWVRQTSAVPPAAATHAPSPPAGPGLVAAPLARLVAAMIAEMIAQVCS